MAPERTRAEDLAGYLPAPPAAAIATASADAPLERFSARQERAASLHAELQSIEKDLKDWWMQRRILRERNLGLYELLHRHNFVGLSINQPRLPDTQRVLWQDLVYGKPDMEDSLSFDAREMKVDMYTKIFTQAADLENVCRIPGVAYLRCLRNNIEASQSSRGSACVNAFSSFDACRKGLLQQQATAIGNRMVMQNMQDLRAKALFERRSVLLDLLEGK
ncbi:uncharacterized protein LOC131479119 [Ochotona princeps]|uniref:uncharacterized protein LOC131479119 n=1 Tax=Ochotona princeps TaxID=9978 RepID=UPI0027153D27|nr:uncharacterized protein LOC131479119 [Ochotona princeps]